MIRSEDEIKVFGIFIRDSFPSMVKRNWDFRLGKFQNVVSSWVSKFLPYLRSRVEVLNVYALSRVYYVGSILPMSKTVAKKFEVIMGNFI